MVSETDDLKDFVDLFALLRPKDSLLIRRSGNDVPTRQQWTMMEAEIRHLETILSDADQLEAAADQAIAACGGDAREAIKALIVANHFLETDLEKLRAAVSMGV